MKAIRFLAVLLVLFVIAAIPSAAAPLTGPCAAGGGYDPACDVDHNGTIDIFDIQLTAGHWTQTGIYNVYPAMVPKTGQTTSYAAGDDGGLQKGVTWPDPRFTDNANGTVTDNLTGLIWLKNANCFGTQDWSNSLNSANALNSGECGLTDGSVEGNWRLPNLREMQSLVDYGQSNPSLPSGHPFIGVLSDHYWSSTTYSVPSNAWFVGLNVGWLASSSKTQGYYVWPVRDGQ